MKRSLAQNEAEAEAEAAGKGAEEAEVEEEDEQEKGLRTVGGGAVGGWGSSRVSRRAVGGGAGGGLGVVVGPRSGCHRLQARDPPSPGSPPSHPYSAGTAA